MELLGMTGGIMRLRSNDGTSMTTPRLLAAILLLGLSWFSLIVGPEAAGTITQSVTNCNDSGTGSLRQAVLDAASGDTISFSLSPLCSGITLASSIIIAQDLTINGPGANALSVSGNNAVEVFHVDSGVTAKISGLTIEKGSSPYGGGIYSAGTLTVADSTLADNSATTGGGGIWSNGTLNVTDCVVSGNSTGYFGGGIYSGSNGTLNVANSTLSGNSAVATDVNDSEYAYGGGIYAYGTAAIADSTLSGNTVEAFGGAGGGGGIYVGGTLNVADSTLSDNDATIVAVEIYGDGGGGILNGGALKLTDSTLSGNSTNVDGGGIANGWTLNVADSTLSGNSATTGGGIFNGGALTVTASTLSNNRAGTTDGGGIDNQPGDTANTAATIVANSTSGGDCSGSITDGGYDLDDDGSCGFTANTDYSDTPAGLDPAGLQNNGGPTPTIALDLGSAPVGAVNDVSLCSTPDQRGVARSTPCDIGAVELALIPQTITFTSPPPPNAVVGGPSYPVSATGGASGSPVSFSVDASSSSVCSISGSTVSFIGVGTCVIDANQAGNAAYSAAPQVQLSFNVVLETQAITSSDTGTATVGSHYSFTVTTSGSPVPSINEKGALPKRLKFSDDGNGTATISGTPTKAGAYPLTITATFGKGKTKNVVVQAFTLTVETAP
jgi:hypothetical protein